MKDNKMSFKILNFNSAVVAPTFTDNRGGWINYGKKNDYPIELLDVYNTKSNKHQAIINKKATMIGGNGFESVPSGMEYLDDILAKISYDLEIYGGFTLKTKWTINGNKVGAIEYMPYQNVRVSQEEDKLWFSNDWQKTRKEGNQPVEIQSFNKIKVKESKLQVYNYHQYSPGNFSYPTPGYSSTLNWIMSDGAIAEFHYNSIENGFSASFLLNFSTGIPSEDEMKQFQKEFDKKYTGQGNAGKFILSFSDGKEGAAELTPIELNSSDDRFILLSEQIRENIFIGHQVINPMLFGVMIPGSLGGKTELLESLELFQSTYVSPKQKQIERVFNEILGTNLKINKYSI